MSEFSWWTLRNFCRCLHQHCKTLIIISSGKFWTYQASEYDGSDLAPHSTITITDDRSKIGVTGSHKQQLAEVKQKTYKTADIKSMSDWIKQFLGVVEAGAAVADAAGATGEAAEAVVGLIV